MSTDRDSIHPSSLGVSLNLPVANLMRPYEYRVRRRAVYFRACAICYALCGLAAMWELAPRVPYADQWRHYARLLSRPSFAGIFAADNGHAEVLPNGVRLVGLLVFSGDQRFEIVAGMLFAVLALVVGLGIVRKSGDSESVVPSGARLVLCLALFWLGNARALTHGNESVHTYLVLLCVFVAARTTLRAGAEPVEMRSVVLAAVMCCIASFSFGAGFASFAAVAALFFVQRALLRDWLMIAGAALACYACYAMLPGSIGASAVSFDPISILSTWLMWLGSPFVYLFWPLVDPAAAANVPGLLRPFATAAAAAWTSTIGNIQQAMFPQAIFGAVAIGFTSLLTLRLRRLAEAASDTAKLGITLAWFGIGAGVLVACARVAYFSAHPDQIYAPRYLPWSSLCWGGLLLAGIGIAPRSRLIRSIVLLLPLLAVPAEVGMTLVSRHVREIAEQSALDAAVGVVPSTIDLGESEIEDMRKALPLLRAGKMAMFAWPEVQSLGREAPARAPLPDATTVTPVNNQLDGPGSTIVSPYGPRDRCERISVMVDGTVAGLLRRASDGTWTGVVRGEPSRDAAFRASSCE